MTESAGTLLRRARLDARLTQAELARRAEVTQSVVSAYESGSRQPSYATVLKFIHAAGFDLGTTLTPRRPQSPGRELVERRKVPLTRTLRRLGATNVRLFGSVARGDDRPDSDVDLLVKLQPGVGLLALARMTSEAERILGKPVDLVPDSSLKAELREHVLAEAVAL